MLDEHINYIRTSRLDHLEREVSLRSDTLSYFESWARCFNVPTLIVSLDLKVLWTNAAALAILRAGDPAGLFGEQLVWMDKAQGPSFRHFIAELGSEPEVWVYRAEDGASLLVRAEALQPDGEAPGVALMIYVTDPEIRYIWADIGKVFGLTRAEVGIVKRIIAGERADFMAEELHVVLDTIRTHIRRIYNKLGVNSREQLFALMSPFRVG